MTRGQRTARDNAIQRRAAQKALRRRRRTTAMPALAAASTAAALAVAGVPAAPAAEPSALELIAQLDIGSSAVLGDTVFFSADDGVHGTELWRSDGTATGTAMVADIDPGADGSAPRELTAVGAELFFVAGYGNVWMSDGTAAGTTWVPGAPGRTDKYDWGPTGLTESAGLLYFVDQNEQDQTFWQSDGTGAGTRLVADRNGAAFPEVADIEDADGLLYFGSNDDIHGRGLWRTDGTTAGTVRVKALDQSVGPNKVYDIQRTDGLVFFVARTPDHGELWTTDGTTAGTMRVKRFAADASLSFPGRLLAHGAEVFFTVYGYPNANELWTSDGTAAGTDRVSAVSAVNERSLVSSGANVFFTTDGSQSLWVTDGTAAGTDRLPVETTPCGTFCDPISYLTDVDGTLYFGAHDDDRGREPWRSDGTAAGTAIIDDVNPGAGDSVPEYLVAVFSFDGSVYLGADDGVRGPALWKLIDTPSGPSCLGQPATITGSGTITGTPGPDVIVASGGADVVDGRGGDDVICALGGNDRVLQGPKEDGADQVEGGDGIDAISYASRATDLHVTLDRIQGDDGAADEGDTVTGVENVLGGSGDDLLIGSATDNRLVGGPGSDTLTGRLGADVEKGGTDADLLLQSDVVDGADVLDGEAGFDTVSYEQRAAGVTVTLAGSRADDGAVGEGDTILATENVIGTNSDDRLYGTRRANRLIGREGDDTINGGDGADVEKGGEGDDLFAQTTESNGADILDGSLGIDTISYSRRSGAVRVNLVNSAAGGNGSPGEGDRTIDVENAIGGRGADHLIGSARANDLRGGPGNDTLDLRDGIRGNDSGNGGAGTDTATSDPGDILISIP